MLEPKVLNFLVKLRKRLEKDYDYRRDIDCFRCMSLEICRIIQAELYKVGLYPKLVQGFYKDADKNLEVNITGWSKYEIEAYGRLYRNNGYSANGIPFTHYWLELQGYIIDLTEEQFKTSNKERYTVSVYKKPVSKYEFDKYLDTNY